MIRLDFAFIACSTASSGQTIVEQQPSQVGTLYAHTGAESHVDQLVVGAGGETVSAFNMWGAWPTSGSANSDTFNMYIKANDTSEGGDSPGSIIRTSFPGLAPVVSFTGLFTPA
ncbi:MAG: hypothetical protein ACI835_001901 [Planctomycetota bacterium]|jgi:hypothetical protein